MDKQTFEQTLDQVGRILGRQEMAANAKALRAKLDEFRNLPSVNNIERALVAQIASQTEDLVFNLCLYVLGDTEVSAKDIATYIKA